MSTIKKENFFLKNNCYKITEYHYVHSDNNKKKRMLLIEKKKKKESQEYKKDKSPGIINNKDR